MKVNVETTFTLSDRDIQQAVAEYLTRTQGVTVTPKDVTININPGSPYYDQFDPGVSPSVKIIASIKPTNESIPPLLPPPPIREAPLKKS